MLDPLGEGSDGRTGSWPLKLGVGEEARTQAHAAVSVTAAGNSIQAYPPGAADVSDYDVIGGGSPGEHSQVPLATR